jgi:trimethylamine--corrinoid protein Co-methyltransferase
VQVAFLDHMHGGEGILPQPACGVTDAKRPDAQAGLECGATLILGAAAGADIFGHMGIAGVDQAASLDMLVLQDEVVAYVESALREIDFSDDAFGLAEIAEAGPGGSFIDREHTAARFRRELHFPRLLDRAYYEAWREAGAASLEQKCRERRETVLATHVVEPLPTGLKRDIDAIVAAARRGDSVG